MIVLRVFIFFFKKEFLANKKKCTQGRLAILKVIKIN